MKISARESGFLEPVSEFPLEWAIARVAKLGYDGVELRVMPDRLAWGPRSRVRGIWHTEYGPEERSELRRYAGECGVEIASLACDWTSGFSEYCDDLAKWDVGLELLRHHVDLAHDLRASVVLVHFGMARGSWEDARSLLTRLAEHAARRDVVVGIEDTIWYRTGLGDRDEVRQMVREIASPNLRVYVHLSGDVEQQVRTILATSDLICGVHSAELDEEIDCRPVLDALRSVGYDWYWCFEVAGASIADSPVAWRRIVQQGADPNTARRRTAR